MDKEIVNNLTGELINPEVENTENDIKLNALLQQKKNKLRRHCYEKKKFYLNNVMVPILSYTFVFPERR